MTATIPRSRPLLLGAAPALVTLAFLAGRAPAGDFTAATLNIWHDQGDWPARRAVILDTLRVLSPDVLFLQEVLEKEGLPNQAQQLADSLGWGFVFASVDPPGAAKRYGNAILTRHRIVATHEIMLPPLDDYRVQRRGGKGLITIKCSERNGRVVDIREVTDSQELMVITRNGIIIRMAVRDISTLGRNTQGVRIISLKGEDDTVVGIADIEAGESLEQPEDGDPGA